MKNAIASAVSAISMIHAALLAVPAFLLVRLWASVDTSPPVAEQLVVVITTLCVVGADVYLMVIGFRAAFRRHQAALTALLIPTAIYGLFMCVFAAFSVTDVNSEFLGNWISAAWKFLWTGLALCVCALSAVRPRSRSPIVEHQ